MSGLPFRRRKNWLFNFSYPYSYPELPYFTPYISYITTYEHWRRVAKILGVSKEARLRLEWIIHYYHDHNASQTSRRFGISTKTLYKWFRMFNKDNIYSMY